MIGQAVTRYGKDGPYKEWEGGNRMHKDSRDDERQGAAVFSYNRGNHNTFVVFAPIVTAIGGFFILLLLVGGVVFFLTNKPLFLVTMSRVFQVFLVILLALLGVLILFLFIRFVLGAIITYVLGAFVTHVWQPLHRAPVFYANENFMAYERKRGGGIEVHDHSEDRYNYRITQAEAPPLLEAPKDDGAKVHVPTFAESMEDGLIGRGQVQLLFCHELMQDEYTKHLTGEIEPQRCQLNDASTLLLCGASKSGKTTYMTHLATQQALMQTLFFCIDPHLNHPDKSLAAKLRPIIDAGYFVLPPAMTDEEVYRVYKALQAECEARVAGRETKLTGYNIVFLVDEIVALMARAERSSNQEVQQMYREFGVFLRDLGVQYNKFGVNGVFGTQYVTKSVLGASEWRDACTGQAILRLPTNQAKALGLLQVEELRKVPQLPTGHGYLVFGGEYDPIRMASGNITAEDVQGVARMLPKSPLAPKTVLSTAVVSEETGFQVETTEKPQRNQSGNQLEVALGADLYAKARKMLAIEAGGGQKPEVMKTVWGVHPGGSDKYKVAEQEYRDIKQFLATRLGGLS